MDQADQAVADAAKESEIKKPRRASITFKEKRSA